MYSQEYKGVALLLCIFLLSMWAVKNKPERVQEYQQEQLEHSADHFAVNYSKTNMNEAGLSENSLMADFAAHYSDNSETELTRPVMTINKANLPPWVMRSKSGIISADGRTMFMNGEVMIDRAATEKVRKVSIKTRNLRIQPERYYAETDEWAEMVSGLDTISGVGMKLFYQDPLYIELLANVKGRHVYE